MGRILEFELAEDDRQVPRVILDRGDVVNRLSQPALLRIRQLFEGAALDVDQMGDFKGVLRVGKNSCGLRGQRLNVPKLATPQAVRGTWKKRRYGAGDSTGARPQKITHGANRPEVAITEQLVGCSREPGERAFQCVRIQSERLRIPELGGFGGLLQLDRGPGLLEFGFEFLSLLALDPLFDRFRGLVDDCLRLF